MRTKLVKKIFIIGEISQESYSSFSKRLSRLERECKPNTKIDIELTSEGGDAYAALAYASRMRSSSLRLVVSAHGLVASAAVMILAYGHTRQMSNEAWVMVHEDSGGAEGEVTFLKKYVKQMEQHEEQWAHLLAVKTRADTSTWRKLHNNTTYLSAKECLALGLIDKII